MPTRKRGYKLTIGKANQIRKIYAKRGWSYRRISAKFGVSESLIGQIIREQIWL